MKTILKYPIKEPTSLYKLTLPRNAKILTIQVQHGTACVWAIIDDDPEIPEEIRTFLSRKTIYPSDAD